METVLLVVWAVVATIIAFALFVLHFANPYPLVQIPDRGHRLYAVPDRNTHDAMVCVFEDAGMKPYGRFNAGAHQTLMRDGFTVIAYGESISKPAISFPVKNPTVSAKLAQRILTQWGITSSTMMPSPELGGRLVVLQLPHLGWDIAYRLHGKDMPAVEWEWKY